jgi:hypothetical protein
MYINNKHITLWFDLSLACTSIILTNENIKSIYVNILLQLHTYYCQVVYRHLDILQVCFVILLLVINKQNMNYKYIIMSYK